MIYKYIIILLLSFLMSDEYTGYIRPVEVSICMDECGEYYLEAENGEYIVNLISFDSVDLNQYLNRFVDIVVGDEYWCVECGAYPVETINFAYDCEEPVECFVDPCAMVDCIDGYNCYSDYCGGCYGDCLTIEEDCVDFSDIDFGMCDMFLGYGWVGDGCQGISGCGWDNNGIDYSDYFFSSMTECENECSDTCDGDEVEINNLCFNALDIAYIQEMIDNSYASDIDLGCEDGDNYCGSPNPYMDSEDAWFWQIVDGETYFFANPNGSVEPLELGLQEWVDGRLMSIMCGAYIYCQLSGEIPEIQDNQLTDIEVFRFEYNYLSGHVPESICNLNLNDDDYLEFDLTGNLLCPPYPECIEDGIGYQQTADCVEIEFGDIDGNGQIDVIDVVLLISFILQEEIPSEIEFIASDFNQDGSLDVLDVVAIVETILIGSNEDTLPDECYLEPDPGVCFAAIPMYYFNQISNSCEQFIWGGCEGVVPFQSISACQEACE